MLGTAVLLAALCWLCCSSGEYAPPADDQKDSAAQNEEASPPIEVKTIAQHLAIIRIAGISTIVLGGEDGVLVVDPGLEETGPFLKKELDKLGWGEVGTVIDTHWHFDHAGGNMVVGREATIVASDATRGWLSTDETILGMDQPAYPPFARPGMVVDATRPIQGHADEVTVRAMPGGHTGGDVVVFFQQAKVLAIGDIVFAGQFPFIDLDHGGDVERLAEVLQEIVERYPRDVKIVPGHGPVLSIDDLVTYRRMVVETTEVVRRQMARGLSPDEMRKDGVLGDWQEWDGSFRQDDWIGFIYESLKADRPDGQGEQ
jgi:glyoxylase-like metal-dependent hydrolase (beta-lactamase superfamily II)